MAVGLVALVLLGLLAQQIYTKAMYARLLRADAERSSDDPALVRFATGQAKAVIAKHCASCHGDNLQGDRARGIPNLTDKDWLYGSGRIPELEQTILYGIRSGTPRAWNLAVMPAFGTANPSKSYKVEPLTPQQIKDVVQYMLLIEDRPADPEAAKRGLVVYTNTGECFDCHANDGAGDQAIGAPNLIDNIWLYGDGSPQSLFNSVARGHQGVCPSWVRRLTPGEIRALAVYIHVVSHQPARTQAAAAPPANQGKPS